MSDLSTTDLSAISDGDNIQLQRAAFEIGRRRHFASKVEDEIDRLAMFCSRPVNRISHPSAVAAIERVLAAHWAACGE